MESFSHDFISLFVHRIALFCNVFLFFYYVTKSIIDIEMILLVEVGFPG